MSAINDLTAEVIRQRWLKVQSHVGEASASAQRDPALIEIIGVSKYVNAEKTQWLVDAGCSSLGESRPQVLWSKRDEVIGPNLRWHMLGHLQRNKVAKTVAACDCLHSLDSLRLAQAISDACEQIGKRLDCLIEVNITGEAEKTGLPPSQLTELAQQCNELPGIRLIGLMGMATHNAPSKLIADQFASLRQMQIDLQPQIDSEQTFRELSMGMSGDFEIAIEQGATMIRIGSTLFR